MFGCKSLVSTLFFSLPLCGHVASHMLISLDSTWGLSQPLENPLNRNSNNWFCHGKTKDTSAVTTLKAGTTISVPIVCGEAIDNPTQGGQICSDDPNAYHGGGGCALSIAYKTSGVGIEDFYMFSVNVDCPKKGQAMINFPIPANLPNGQATCAWTWIPPEEFSAPEMYQLCFNCAVTGGPTGTITSGEKLSKHLFAVPYQGVRNEGDRGLYRDVFKNGLPALQVSTSGSQSTTSSTSRSSTRTSTTTVGRTSTTTTTARPTTTVISPSGLQSWLPYKLYTIGERVTFSGKTYECGSTHLSFPNENPSTRVGLWKAL